MQFQSVNKKFNNLNEAILNLFKSTKRLTRQGLKKFDSFLKKYSSIIERSGFDSQRYASKILIFLIGYNVIGNLELLIEEAETDQLEESYEILISELKRTQRCCLTNFSKKNFKSVNAAKTVKLWREKNEKSLQLEHLDQLTTILHQSFGLEYLHMIDEKNQRVSEADVEDKRNESQRIDKRRNEHTIEDNRIDDWKQYFSGVKKRDSRKRKDTLDCFKENFHVFVNKFSQTEDGSEPCELKKIEVELNDKDYILTFRKQKQIDGKNIKIKMKSVSQKFRGEFRKYYDIKKLKDIGLYRDYKLMCLFFIYFSIHSLSGVEQFQQFSNSMLSEFCDSCVKDIGTQQFEKSKQQYMQIINAFFKDLKNEKMNLSQFFRLCYSNLAQNKRPEMINKAIDQVKSKIGLLKTK